MLKERVSTGPLVWRNSYRLQTTYILVGITIGLLAGRMHAQTTAADSQNYEIADSIVAAQQATFAQEDSTRLHSSVQVWPHQLHFDPHTTSATLEFRNTDSRPKVAQVQVQFPYLAWPHGLPADTMLISPSQDILIPYDTVIPRPGPKEHFVGRWLSGVPTQVTLAPHETKRVTIRLTPPYSLPDGEYWARIITLVPPAKGNKGPDERQRYRLPTKGVAPILQDSCQVVYRQGVLHMGLVVGPGALARIDSTDIAGTDPVAGSHMLWIRLPLRLTGNVPFVGQIHFAYHNLTTGETVRPNSKEVMVFQATIMHIAVETDVLPPGHYTLDLLFDNTRTDVPAGKRIPMDTVRQSFTFETKPAYAY